MEEHIKWLSLNEEKKPKLEGTRQAISHFYSSGSVCQKTGDKRETEVRYKCVKGRHNEDSVALYLLEPKTCKYILTIESPSLCELINGPMDEYGLFTVKPRSYINSEKSSSSSKTESEDKVEKSVEDRVQVKVYNLHVKVKDTVPPVEQDTEVSKEKKTGKIEL